MALGWSATLSGWTATSAVPGDATGSDTERMRDEWRRAKTSSAGRPGTKAAGPQARSTRAGSDAASWRAASWKEADTPERAWR